MSRKKSPYKYDSVSRWNYKASDGKTYVATVNIDMIWLLMQMAEKAVQNKGKRTTNIAQAVVVTVEEARTIG